MTQQLNLTRTALVAVVASALLMVTGSGSESAWAGNDASAASPASGTTAVGSTSATGTAAAPAPARADTVAESATVAAKAGPAAKSAAKPVAKPVAKPAATPVAKPVAQPAVRATSARATTKPAAVPTTVSTSKSITISRYTNAPGSQAAVNECKLVLWTTRPMWLAAHNYCGFQWLATVPTGTVITITTGVAAGRYLVTSHIRLTRQGGSIPTPKADLVLQTCVGSGTGLTLARRLG